MSNFTCPKCGCYTITTNVVVNKREVTRYRTCARASCHLHFSTVEAVKDTPRTRQAVGEDLASKLWPEQKRFLYRNPNRARKKQDKPNT